MLDVLNLDGSEMVSSGTNVSESLCIGMTRKQDGDSNGFSNYTTITRLGVSATHFEALFYLF